jgi:hypothetical protein
LPELHSACAAGASVDGERRANCPRRAQGGTSALSERAVIQPRPIGSDLAPPQ